MEGTTAVRRILICTVVLVMLTTTITPMIVGASDQKTTNEYFDTFRAMDGTEAYQEYEEFETIRTFAVSQTQEVGTLDSEESAQLATIEETMESFETAYTQAEDGEYEESLETAESTEESIEELREYEGTQATLANLALSRFYGDLASNIHDEAEATERTPTQIELLSMTATAYERAERPDTAAEFNLQAERRTAEYEAATDQIDSTESSAESFLEGCHGCGDIGSALAGATNPVSTFQQYKQAQATTTDLQSAQSEAESHGLEDRLTAIQTLNDDVESAWLSLLIASVSVLLGYGLIVGAVSTALLVRIFAWRRTYDKAQVGSVVTVGESDV